MLIGMLDFVKVILIQSKFVNYFNFSVSSNQIDTEKPDIFSYSFKIEIFFYKMYS